MPPDAQDVIHLVLKDDPYTMACGLEPDRPVATAPSAAAMAALIHDACTKCQRKAKQIIAKQ